MRRVVWGVILGGLTACGVELRVPTDAAITCAGRADCPIGWTCSTGLCVLQKRACTTDEKCSDGSFCNGTETCVDGFCVGGDPPCVGSFPCVLSSCIENGPGTGSCSVSVDHTVCADGEYCNPTVGCTRGEGCQSTPDCQDDSVCNGEEQCVNFLCVNGQPPSLDDADSCTLDGCDDRRVNSGLDPIFHAAQPLFDGVACTLPGSGGDGVCVSSKGGCVESECGDGVVAAGEDCEDGNANPNDGCDGCRRTHWTSRVLVGRGEGQGSATGVGLNFPSAILVDRNGNLFFADTSNHRVQRVDAVTGVITTVAGTGELGNSGDGGSATSANLNDPFGVAIDRWGNLFISDMSNARVRRVDGERGIITTVAGTGSVGFSGDGGMATAAELHSPQGLALDGLGNLLIADSQNHCIRRVDAVTGIITTVAGIGAAGFSGDTGPAASANLNAPSGICLDGGGSLFIADQTNHRIRRVDAVSTEITTVAGSSVAGFSGDGYAATAASLRFPRGVSVDGSGNLLIADTANHAVRRVDAVTGIITTLAGTGTGAFSGDDGPAVSAQLLGPRSLAVDLRGGVIIADSGNHRIRRIDGTSGAITTVAGTGAAGFSGDGSTALSVTLLHPRGLAIDSAGDLFVADQNDHRIRRVAAQGGIITTVAGTRLEGFSGDGGAATNAQLWFPGGVSLDGSGNLFIADLQSHRIRRVDATSHIITTVAGTGVQGFSGDASDAASAEVNSPEDVAADTAGNLFIADTVNHRVRRVDATSHIITTVAGTGISGFSGDDDVATSAQITNPLGVAVDGSGNLFIADTQNQRIRRVDAASHIITSVAGSGAVGFSGDHGPATDAAFAWPYAVAVNDAGDLFIADLDNYRIRRVDGLTGVITTVAGDGTLAPSGDGGPATDAGLGQPTAVKVDASGNLFVADMTLNRVRRVDAASGVITTVVGPVDPRGDGPVSSSVLGTPVALVELASVPGTWLVADGTSGRVRALDLGADLLTTRIGYLSGVESEGTAARTSRLLREARGIAFDAADSAVFVSEYAGQTIRRVDIGASPWTISTFAGALVSPGYLTGDRTAARFTNPSGLSFDPSTGRLLVADAGNHVIRSIDVDSGTTATIAGTPRFRGFFGEAIDALDALLNGPQAMALGNDGSLYIADTGNNRVRRVDAAGVIDTVLGDGSPASSGEGGPARYFPVDQPQGLAVDSSGNLFVSSRTAVRLVTAGADAVATGDDDVMTVYGRAPREIFPESVTHCLTGLAVLGGDGGTTDGRLYVLDACAGYMLQLDREVD